MHKVVISKEDLGIQAVQSYSEIPEVTNQYDRFGKCLQDNGLGYFLQLNPPDKIITMTAVPQLGESEKVT